MHLKVVASSSASSITH